MQKAAEKTLDYIFTSSVSHTHLSEPLADGHFAYFVLPPLLEKREGGGKFGYVNQKAIHLPVIDERNAKERENGISRRKEIMSNDFQISFLLCTDERRGRGTSPFALNSRKS